MAGPFSQTLCEQGAVLHYKLKKPIIFGSETINALTFREPVFKDIKKLDPAKLTAESIMEVASKLSGTEMAILDNLSIADSTEVLELVGKLLNEHQGDGKKL